MAYDKEAEREEREWYISHGVCVRCHCDDARPGKTMCLLCADIVSEDSSKRYNALTTEQKKEVNKKKTAGNRKRREERERQGLCTKCGKQPPRENRKTCIECRLADNRRSKQYRKKKSEEVIPLGDRNALGLCRHCCEPLAHKDEKLCPKCHEKCSKPAKELNENPTLGVLKAREDFGKRNREFRNSLFYASQIQKRADRAAIENYERMCKSYI